MTIMWKKVQTISSKWSGTSVVCWFGSWGFSTQIQNLYLSVSTKSCSTGSSVGLSPLKNCPCEQQICSLTCNKLFTGLNVSPLGIHRFPPPQDEAHDSLLLASSRTEATLGWVSTELDTSITHPMRHNFLMLFIHPFSSIRRHLFIKALPPFSLLFRTSLPFIFPRSQQLMMESTIWREQGRQNPELKRSWYCMNKEHVL